MSNILVTGANGFIGTHLVHNLCNNGNTVVAMIRDERNDLWTKKALNSAIKVRVDLNNPKALQKIKRVLSFYHIDEVYHLASQPIVSRAKKTPLITYATNIMGTAKVLEAARTVDGTKILYISTDKIYGGGHTESTDGGMMSSEPYSSSKICAEYIVHDYRREFGLNISVVRPCNMIGYDPYNPTRIVPATIIRLINEELPVIHHTSHKGSHRQYIFVNDAIQIMKGSIGKNSYFNIGSPYILSPKQIINIVCEYMGTGGHYEILPIVFHEIKKQSLGYDHDFHYTPIEEAIMKTIQQFKTYYWSWKDLK